MVIVLLVHPLVLEVLEALQRMDVKEALEPRNHVAQVVVQAVRLVLPVVPCVRQEEVPALVLLVIR